ncbi:MAG: alpha amylase C-terminal domain-containing protein [Sedimentisphaeraceae bacterium JB056]
MIEHCKLKKNDLLDDEYLKPFYSNIERRRDRIILTKKRFEKQAGSLKEFAGGHHYFGLHKSKDGWVFREWAPNAKNIYIVGEFSNWLRSEKFALRRLNDHGNWEIKLAPDILKHGMQYCISIHWKNGDGQRLPSYARRVVQDPDTKIFDAQVWFPEEPYKWKNKSPENNTAPLIYESHVGMAQEYDGVGSYKDFSEKMLKRIVDAGYNTVQLMALMEHPYYGSFGYHVSNFFAASSRFGTPEELKDLIDKAHGMGLRVIMDLVHSHSVRNENEGLGCFDGTNYLYFHEGPRGVHKLWDSYCFDYGKSEVLHFLLSNCRFWLEEYNIDGFRFDGITSMLYTHHGMSKVFTSYNDYFCEDVDEDAYVYLALANELIHEVKPSAITIAEDVSGMPGLAASTEQGGCGFDYRMAMGVADLWFKMMDISDEHWPMSSLAYELFNRRKEEKTISYVECHDQALVGGKTAIFTLLDSAMYYDMHKNIESMVIDRGIALHKMMRIATAASAAGGYLNFMGNEFGHPEWIDFPREGNNWSYHYARRQWCLQDDKNLKYHYLSDFDKSMISFLNEKNLIEYRPQLLYVNDHDKIIAFERGGYFFFFNFNPVQSFTDYGIVTLPGEYRLILDSDEKQFGGFGRLMPGQSYYTMTLEKENEIVDILRLYLPARCCLVLERVSGD